MQNFLRKIIFVFIALLVVNTSFGQADQRAQTTKIADLLALLPAQNTEQLNKNMEAISTWGSAGLTEMVGMLAAPGKGNNTSLEFALGSYSSYVTKPGKEQLRQVAVQSYCAAIDKLGDVWSKEFVIRQLQATGKDDAVPCLQKFLSQEILAEAAARALADIHTDAAEKALMGALAASKGSIHLSIMEALGYSRYKPAQSAMISMADNSDPKMKKIALYSLAKMADPANVSVLANAAKKANYTFDNTDAVASYLAYLHELAASAGNVAMVDKAAKELLASSKIAGQLHTRTAALKLLAGINKEKSLPLLYAAMKDTSSKYRAAALGFASSYLSPAVNKQLLQSVATASPAAKAQVITLLGTTGDKSLQPAMIAALKDKNAAVRMAAIIAAGKIGQESALPLLLNLLKKGSASELEAVSTALLTMKGDNVPQPIAASLHAMPSAAKVALINVLAAKAADQSSSAVLTQLAGNDTAVHRAAVNALPYLSQQKDLPKLFSLLNAASSANDISALQKSIIAASAGVGDTLERTKMITSQMGESSSKGYLLLEVLGAVGGKEALNEIQSSFDKGDDQAKRAALGALSKSNSVQSAKALLAIAQKPANSAYVSTAINGYIQLISKLSAPGAQKLLMLREGMALAKTDAHRKMILREVGKCNTFLAMIYAGLFIDDAPVQQEAANAVVAIGLANKEFSGDLVRKLMTKSAEVIKGGDSQYLKTAVAKQLAEMGQGAGFVLLYNGRDLTGWKGLVADPVKRAKMSADTLAKYQEKADKEMATGWQAKDELLVFTGHGNNLSTVKQYGDFEMFVDWKIPEQGDAGIYLRGTPQVQIWDTSRHDVGAQVGSGGLYNNQKNQSKPLKVADNAVNEWNTFYIIMKGDKVTVFLNGELVTDNVPLENYWNRNMPLFAKEQIELQAHGTYVAYRNIYLKELGGSETFVLSDDEKKEGFQVLFDGSNLDKWTGNKIDYTMDNGDLVVSPKDTGHGNIYTAEEFSDFNFRFDFQLTPGANNGLGIRAPLTGDAAYVGMELQILDNTADIYKSLKPFQYHGSVYGIIAAKKGVLKPVGEWNSQEVIAKGDNIKIILNGEVILDGNIREATKNGTPDGQKHPGLFNTTGHIGFLGHGSMLRFRNIRIKDLAK